MSLRVSISIGLDRLIEQQKSHHENFKSNELHGMRDTKEHIAHLYNENFNFGVSKNKKIKNKKNFVKN